MKFEIRRNLYAARELVELAIVQACLDALHVVLHLDHPTIAERSSLGDPITLRRARRVDRFARGLRRAIGDYRRAVQADIDNEADELPF
jgi:hypothetical protein